MNKKNPRLQGPLRGQCEDEGDGVEVGVVRQRRTQKFPLPASSGYKQEFSACVRA